MLITLDGCVVYYFNNCLVEASRPVKVLQDLKSLQTLLVQSDSALRNAVNGRLNVCPIKAHAFVWHGSIVVPVSMPCGV